VEEEMKIKVGNRLVFIIKFISLEEGGCIV
jgi:hypothetical protein